MPLRLLIWGGGGHGKVVADVVRSLGHTIVGYVDADPAKLEMTVEPGGSRVVMTQDHLLEHLEAGNFSALGVDAVVPAIGSNATRHDSVPHLGDYAAPALVHPFAIVSPSAQIGSGTVVFPGAVVNAAARIGKGVIINTGAVVEHDCVVGDTAHVSPNAALSGGVRVGERSWIGAGAVVIPGVHIGADVVVGAGAVILGDVPASVTIVGNPGRMLSRK